MVVRLYVGGLPADTTADLLAQRFKPFGDVLGCEIVTEKPGWIPKQPVPAGQPAGCRGFAYLNLQPKDDTSVARCLSLVRGAGLEACRRTFLGEGVCHAACAQEALVHVWVPFSSPASLTFSS